MAGTQRSGDGPNIAVMSKDQLYDIMFQMKSLIEQNQQQARQILTQNPLLTKGLFQAQIMLGMVKPPQVVPNIQSQVPQNPQETVKPAQKTNAQPASMISGQVGMQSSAPAPQVLVIPRKRHQDQPSLTNSSSTAPAMSHQPQSTLTNPLQLPQRPVRPLNPPVPPMSLPESSRLPKMPAPLSHASQPHHRLQNLAASSKSQQSLQSGFSHLPSQQPLPQQVRPSPTPAFHGQYPPKMSPNFGPEHGSASHKLPQSMFHPGTKASAEVGPIVSQGELSVPDLPPAQRRYPGGAPHTETKFKHQMVNPMQIGTGSSFVPSSSVQSSIAGHLGQQPIAPDQNNRSSGTAPALSPEMERQLLQQVMNLTPEQLNLLPPEQRNQVLHLQQMLHK